ncbi:MAG: response regulator transcription factor [Bacteroidota bacterium]
MKTKILYVEDEPFLAKIVRETLEGSGFEVSHVADGHLALKAYESVCPDICILDVMLPGKDGFSLGLEIRKTDAQIPIIYLTAKDQTKDLVKGFSSGGNDYIKKPFSMEELIIRINNLLQLTTQQKNTNPLPDVFQLGQIQFNPLRMELRTHERQVQLSHRENELLKMLCENINGQVERKQILLQIWGDDSFFNSRNLDVYIRKIRNYLALDTNVQLITLKGIGYRLVVA